MPPSLAGPHLRTLADIGMFVSRLPLWLILLFLNSVASLVLPGTGEDTFQQTKQYSPKNPVEDKVDYRRPRSWNRPYQGTPTAKCRRNHGSMLSDVSAQLQSFEREDVNDRDLDLVRMELDVAAKQETAQSTTSLVARQPHNHPPVPINNHILAAFHFRCPQGGSMSQIFFWGVVYSEHYRNIFMVGWHNIWVFTGTSLVQYTGFWTSTWTSRWCVPHDKLQCWYTGGAHTQGRLYYNSRTISIEVLNPGPGHAQSPSIYEHCAEIGVEPSFTHGSSCIIEEVQSFVQGPRHGP